MEIGEQYQCRKDNYMACIIEDVSKHDKIYSLKGYVFDMNTGEAIRNICMWTVSGNYSIDHETYFDIISVFK